MKIKKTQLWLGLSFLLLIIMIGVNVFLNYKYSSIEGEVKKMSTLINQNKAQSKELVAIESNLKSTVQDRDKLNSFFVTSDGIIPFIEDLEGLMKESGVTGEVRDVSDKVTTAGPNDTAYYNMTLSFYGSWQNVTDYIALIENLPYLVSVESLNFSYGKAPDKPEGKDSKSGDVWTALISLKVGTIAQSENNAK